MVLRGTLDVRQFKDRGQQVICASQICGLKCKLHCARRPSMAAPKISGRPECIPGLWNVHVAASCYFLWCRPAMRPGHAVGVALSYQRRAKAGKALTTGQRRKDNTAGDVVEFGLRLLLRVTGSRR
jgi:hypothetical protein